MRAIIQRVSEACVSIEGKVSGQIGPGLLVFLGIVEGDSQQEADWLVAKITRMRIFADDERKMNRCLEDVDEPPMKLLHIFAVKLLSAVGYCNLPVASLTSPHR